ncbi:hypothetical protein GCM10022409_06190 [Hymenobacter glaciei]|uniref:Carboxypeptidase-like regulatory domain-containing protein n=1 Tax=Hymenobacter glaciei TaxID=877209 RepID=A0ABP7TEA9_9BACT
MLLALPFLLLLSCLAPANDYQAVIVNATTSRPLAGVSIVDLQNQAGSVTDAQGRFGLAGPVAHFRLHSLGFADLEATRAALLPGQVDTLRLLPDAILLAEVSVRPAKPVELSSIGTKAGKPHGSVIVPGAQYGILFQPAANMLPAVVQQINVRFHPGHCAIGRVRVRLVAPERHSLMTPSAHDLVPIAATYTAAELAALPNHLLTIDLSAYNIRLPATGFYVLLEGLATVAGETYVTDKLVSSKGTLTAVVVTASDPTNPATFRETPAFDYPAVSWTSSLTEVETVTRLGANKSWTIKHQERSSPKTDNVDISLSILAE